MKFRILPFLALSVAVWAQQSGSTQPKSAPGSTRSQSGAGSVSDTRNATMPQSGEQGPQRSQNQLVGCLSQQGPNLVLMQPRQRRWYRLRGNEAQLKNDVGKMVKVSGRLVLGQTSAFDVRQVQVVQDKCELEATRSALPATGKTGQSGTAETVTSTGSVEQTTPGVQTERGVAQNPAKGGHGTTAPPSPTASQAAPPNPNVENPDEARRIANAAQQSELSSSTQLGVNAQPNYSNANNPQANAQAVANTAQQERGQASASDQVFKGGEKQAPAGQTAQNSQNAQPGKEIISGCLTQDGKQFWLSQQGSGRLRLEGDASKLQDHVNHMVQLVGDKTGTYGPAVGTSGNFEGFRVQAVQDVAPTCQKQ